MFEKNISAHRNCYTLPRTCSLSTIAYVAGVIVVNFVKERGGLFQVQGLEPEQVAVHDELVQAHGLVAVHVDFAEHLIY